MTLKSEIQGIISDLMSDKLIPSLMTTATYKKRVKGAFDFDTMSHTTTETTAAVKVALENFSTRDIQDSEGRIKSKDVKVTIEPQSGVDMEAFLDDEVIINSNTYRAKDVQKEVMGGTDLIYYVHMGFIK